MGLLNYKASIPCTVGSAAYSTGTGLGGNPPIYLFIAEYGFWGGWRVGMLGNVAFKAQSWCQQRPPAAAAILIFTKIGIDHHLEYLLTHYFL